MKKILLEKLIYKNYLKTSLTSLLLIEVLLIFIYFSVNNNMTTTSVNFMLKDIKENTYELVESRIENLSNKFAQVENLTKIIQNEHEYFFSNPKLFEYKTDEKLFKYSPYGVYYKYIENGGSSLILSRNTKLTKSLEDTLYKTEYFDRTFKSIVQSDKSIIAAYFNSKDNYSRYYPYIFDIFKVFPNDLDMNNYNFYYKAKKENNPSQKPIWTDVYLDPAGKGWMISSVAPIYNKNKLEGVSGIDVTIDTFIKEFLNIKLPYDGKSFILGSDGKIIAMPKGIETVLNIDEVTPYDYKNSLLIEKTIYKSDKFNLLNYHDEKVAYNFKNILASKPYSHKITFEGKNYLIFSKKLEKTSWYIISLIPEDKILEKINTLKSDYQKLGYLIISCILMFYLLFFVFLYYKAKCLVNDINKPLMKVVELTRNLGKTKSIGKLENCGIEEIDKLSDNFNQMTKELEIRTQKLVKSETKRVLVEKLANTDPLSGAYNRRFLDEFIEGYFKIVKREHSDLSLLLIDIDDFKSINDNFGHDIGDEVIRDFAKLTKSTIRKNDLLVRFGGDEFLILLPNTKKEASKKVAIKLVNKIDEFKSLNKDKKYNYTISIGSASYNKDDNCIDDIIIRADEALYTAKANGKNTIV
ncbi:diguanylate cyclase [Arcobacter roscoffensis]|uniref:diguanylate cyclase n=1 Tax=Arcobacter roscoffensis TaxID=2961520 RepID=A0ABY5E6D7_9BACT|nr:diguanylate cyclase [Arcobacter roscoffensis]UTJ07714.1 diguanylate cyclase [Arcobacter roscoffensis]